MKRLFKSLDKWRYLLITSLLLAFISAIIALSTPNKLSSLTDVITEGIKPQLTEEKIEEILKDKSIDQKISKSFYKYLKR